MHCRKSSTTEKSHLKKFQIVRQGSSIMSVDRGSVSRDYVYSLHHNFRTNLLYGKNNVCVAAPGEETPIKGKQLDKMLAVKFIAS